MTRNILIPKNWQEYQHYKDRAPPWVKLHRKLLDDRDFMSLPLASKGLAPMLWLLASEHKDGHFNGSLQELAFRLRINEKEIGAAIKPLLDKGLFSYASTMLADCTQMHTIAVPETETETETETEKPNNDGRVNWIKKIQEEHPETDEQVIKDWLAVRRAKKAAMTETAWAGMLRESKKANLPVGQVLKICAERGWQGFNAGWMTNDQQQTPTPKPRKLMPKPGDNR